MLTMHEKINYPQFSNWSYPAARIILMPMLAHLFNVMYINMMIFKIGVITYFGLSVLNN